MIRLAPQGDEEASAAVSDRVFAALSTAADGKVELRRVEFVGPQVGEELREQGGLAVLFALIGVLIYVALRFEWRFAVGAVAATVHDVIVTVGVFSLFQIPFDLTVLGRGAGGPRLFAQRHHRHLRPGAGELPAVRKGTVIEIVNRPSTRPCPAPSSPPAPP
jgi:hypothetical protein